MSNLKNRLDKLEGKGSPMIGLAERLEAARERFHDGCRHPQKSEDELNAIIAICKSNLSVRMARGQLRAMGLRS